MSRGPKDLPQQSTSQDLESHSYAWERVRGGGNKGHQALKKWVPLRERGCGQSGWASWRKWWEEATPFRKPHEDLDSAILLCHCWAVSFQENHSTSLSPSLLTCQLALIPHPCGALWKYVQVNLWWWFGVWEVVSRGRCPVRCQRFLFPSRNSCWKYWCPHRNWIIKNSRNRNILT